jgi:hypothetical protein
MKTAIIRSACGICAVAAFAAVGAGCDNRHVLGAVGGGAGTTAAAGTTGIAGDIGSAGAAGGSSGGSTGGGGGPEVGTLGPSQSWTGYIENFQFRSGSDAVKITFASDAAGNMVGTVALGSGQPPPPATDPNVGYPADLLAGSSAAVIGAAGGYIAEGFRYSIRAGTVTGSRLRFGIRTGELWTGWCALQTPIPPTGQCDEAVCQSTCLPNAASMIGPNGCALANPTTHQYEPVDCGKLALCGAGGVCLCYASGCTVRDDGGSLISFDLAVTNDTAFGSVTLSQNNAHFTKDP